MNYGQANHYNREAMLKEQAAQQQEQYGGGLGGQIKNAQISPMQRSVEHLQKQVSQLEDTLTVLSQRLTIVTKPQPPEPPREAGIATCTSPLVERIDGITSHLNRLTQAVTLQLELLEL